MQEPAGHSRWLWGFRSAVDVGDGATAAGLRGDGCEEAASLCLRAVQPIPHDARCEGVDSDIDGGRARVRCRRRSACGCGLDYAIPAHGAVSRFVAVASGGPRGCLQRAKVSMMIMRPPQQRHGGR